ncbi:glycoside hydrolase family 32 protein [soil metagenome]
MKINKNKNIIIGLACMLTASFATAQNNQKSMQEIHRPQVHFSPKAHWVNDPNGMVYYKGVYHLFFQYHPGSSVWGPMHWGHATSKDLVHWKELPVAIYPDSLGTIFSGSAVVDENNTSVFGKDGKVPLVAIFTQHDMVGEKAGRNNFQNQSLAYSLDDGETWTKYAGNPVLKNPGIVDFRDPKVMWYAPQKKWIMTLATKDRITFYASPDLKNWERQSEFGQSIGAHGGVWECPDLFSMDDNGKQVWVLIVNLNPGGPNGGSSTQYFLGDFDGKTFTPYSEQTKWLDYGPDDYAGITWSNTGDRKIFLGWMSNWNYANLVPTETWRNAMTIPRELSLKHAGNDLLIASEPVKEFDFAKSKPVVMNNLAVSGNTVLNKKISMANLPCRININMHEIKDWSLILSNELGEQLIVGFDKSMNQYYIDRSKSGKIDFEKNFGARHVAPRFTTASNMDMTLIIDVSSVELFADGGLTVMTEIFFPNKPYNKINIQSTEPTIINKLEYKKLESIWK